MIFKNLLRRKGRTFLTMFGIAIGVAAIIGLGAMADGIDGGYGTMIGGSQSDLVLSQLNAIDISLSSIDESVEQELLAMPEVAETSGMIQGFVQSDDIPLFFVFGYPEDSFVLPRFKIVAGNALDSHEARLSRGTPMMLGLTASEILGKTVGDSVSLGKSAFRVVGIYETGDTFEDSGAIVTLSDAQVLVGKPRQVSLYYIKLKDIGLRDRLTERAARVWTDLELSGTDEYANKQMMGEYLRVFVWVIAGLAIVIGGVGMMNAQLMAVMERTREIGVLRALGWSRFRVMMLILGESLAVGIIGAFFGILLGWLFLKSASDFAAIMGSSASDIGLHLIVQAFITVTILGVVGGAYPAWQASKMQPIEAIRYEGGSISKKVRRLPFGGLAVQGLWQRTSRTMLTLGAIGLTVGSLLALDNAVRASLNMFSSLMSGGDAEIVLRQADVADTSLSAVDESIIERIALLPEVQATSPMVLAVAGMSEMPFFLIQGYPPNSLAAGRFAPIEGSRITGNRQVMLGRTSADALNTTVGKTVEINGSRYKVVGIYETGVSWEEMGALMSLRDAQIIAGRPRKATIVSVKVFEPGAAPALVAKINSEYPEVHAALTGDFVSQMPDIKNMDIMMNMISFLAIAVGGISVMNTMLMSVLERTREIGVLRALGWSRAKILGLILRESILLGSLGGISGLVIAFLMVGLMNNIQYLENAVSSAWEISSILRAITIAIVLGAAGGLYPAYRATRLAPIEALRYE